MQDAPEEKYVEFPPVRTVPLEDAHLRVIVIL